VKNVGFVGLGAMGAPMAANILAAGHKLAVGFHRSRAAADDLAAKGASLCDSWKQVGQQSDVVFTVVPDAPEVEQVLFGKDGLAEGLKPGSVVFEMSTIDLTASRDFARRLAERKVILLDAPISGGVPGARGGSLAIMVGGDKASFESHRDLLGVLGKAIVYCGSNGLGLAAKLANNLIALSSMAAIAEAFSLAVKAGIDPKELYEVLHNATADSRMLNAKAPMFLSGNYTPGFKLSLAAKDLGVITTAAKKLGSPALVSTLVEQIYRLALDEHGDKDTASVALLYQKLAKVSFAAPPKA
jgi:2-hydroxy-3-oxopropionate reductase